MEQRLQNAKDMGIKIPDADMKQVKHVFALLECVENTKKYMQMQGAYGLKGQLDIAHEKKYDQDEVYKG